MEIPTLEFDKLKICIDFIPDERCKLNMYYKIFDKVSYTKLTTYDGAEWFSPWIKMKDRFGGDTLVNECNVFQGVTQPKILSMKIYGKFFQDKTKNYPAYIGYFDNFFKASKAFKLVKPTIKDHLRFERALDENVEKQIDEFKIRK